jgi:hypothetical protein
VVVGVLPVRRRAFAAEEHRMLTRRALIVMSAVCAAGIAPAMADDPTARAFVAAIYETYIGKNGNGVALDSDKALHRYFEPTLAALMAKDEKDARKNNQPPTFDGDPFIDGQDWDIAAYDIAMAEPAPGKATATVKFDNANRPTTVVLDLVKIKNDWRITDVTWQHDGKAETLRGLYRH